MLWQMTNKILFCDIAFGWHKKTSPKKKKHTIKNVDVLEGYALEDPLLAATLQGHKARAMPPQFIP